jgi:hypothetical protein
MSAKTWQRYCRPSTSNWFRPRRLNVGIPYSLALEENLVAVLLPCRCSDVHALIPDLFATVLMRYLELHTCSISFRNLCHAITWTFPDTYIKLACFKCDPIRLSSIQGRQ